MVASGDPLMYCNDWLHGHDSLPISNLSSQRISDLLGTLSSHERDGFYTLWSQLNQTGETEYISLDITSESSYSELIGDVEWGYNRDHVTAAFAKKQVESERKDIDRVENTIVTNGHSMRAVTNTRVWNSESKVFTHIYFSARKTNGIRENLFAKIALLKESAEKKPAECAADSECQRYLHIRKSEKQPGGYSVSIRNDVIEKELSTAGWVILISNVVSDAKTAMSIYRDKNVVEKCFPRIKNSIDLGRLRVHSNESKDNKMFIGFVASVIMAEISRLMVERALFRSYTMSEMLKLLDRQKVQYIKGEGILYPISKAQREVFEAFGIDVPALL